MTGNPAFVLEFSEEPRPRGISALKENAHSTIGIALGFALAIGLPVFSFAGNLLRWQPI
jgi:hypothetical protein